MSFHYTIHTIILIDSKKVLEKIYPYEMNEETILFLTMSKDADDFRKAIST